MKCITKSNIQSNQNNFEANWEERVEDFDSCGLNRELLRGIYIPPLSLTARVVYQGYLNIKNDYNLRYI